MSKLGEQTHSLQEPDRAVTSDVLRWRLEAIEAELSQQLIPLETRIAKLEIAAGLYVPDRWDSTATCDTGLPRVAGGRVVTNELLVFALAAFESHAEMKRLRLAARVEALEGRSRRRSRDKAGAGIQPLASNARRAVLGSLGRRDSGARARYLVAARKHLSFRDALLSHVRTTIHRHIDSHLPRHGPRAEEKMLTVDEVRLRLRRRDWRSWSGWKRRICCSIDRMAVGASSSRSSTWHTSSICGSPRRSSKLDAKLSELNTTMHQEFRAETWRLVTVMLGVIAAVGGIVAAIQG